jgi:hypothetical protein
MRFEKISCNIQIENAAIALKEERLSINYVIFLLEGLESRKIRGILSSQSLQSVSRWLTEIEFKLTMTLASNDSAS